MPAISTARLTASQFLKLGEDPPGVRLELVDGEIEVSPSPTFIHSYADKMLTTILNNHILKHDLGQLFGDVDTIFGEHDVRRPDLLFYRKDRTHLIGQTPPTDPPDLAVEIVSPSSSETDRVHKFRLYEAHGVAHYWIVDPAAKTLEGWSLRDGQYAETGKARSEDTISLPPFPDRPIPLAKLWLPQANQA